MKDLEMKAITDKIVAISLVPQKISLGDSKIVLPDEGGFKPQLYSKVISVGEDVKGVKVGDVVMAHPQAGMTVIFEQYFGKVFKEEEIYGVLDGSEVTEDDYQQFRPTQKDDSKIIKPDTGIVK